MPSRFLTPDVIDSTLGPTISHVLGNGPPDVISIGLLVSVWSGSRALNVFVDTISIMYGQSGVRGDHPHPGADGSASTSSRSFIGAIVILPLVLIGPVAGRRACCQSRLGLPGRPLLAGRVVVTAGSLTTLFHISTPAALAVGARHPGRGPRAHHLGAVFPPLVPPARIDLHSIGGSQSIYGPLAAPIVVLIWLYFLAIAVLIGAAPQRRHAHPLAGGRAAGARGPQLVRRWLRREVGRRREDRDDRREGPRGEDGRSTGAAEGGRRGAHVRHERPLTPMPARPSDPEVRFQAFLSRLPRRAPAEPPAEAPRTWAPMRVRGRHDEGGSRKAPVWTPIPQIG